jgi:hypothetical protein
MNKPLTNYEIEGRFWYTLNTIQLFQNVPLFKREEFLKSDTFVYFTQLFYEFQHYIPVILFDVYLTSSCLLTELSEFITCFQYTNISVHKHSVCILRQQETNIPACCSVAGCRQEGGNNIYFNACTTKIPMWSIYGCIYLMIYFLAIGLKEMK